MTLEQIDNLTLNGTFFTILYRLGFDLNNTPEGEQPYTIDEDELLSMYERVTLNDAFVKPVLGDMDAELVIYKQGLTDTENIRLAEVARIQDLKDRYEVMKDRDAGMPAFLELFPDIPNNAVYFRDMILGESDKSLAESRLKAIEDADIKYKADQDSTAYIDKRIAEYPHVRDLVIAMWENDQVKKDELEAQRQAVKIKYPKP